MALQVAGALDSRFRAIELGYQPLPTFWTSPPGQQQTDETLHKKSPTTTSTECLKWFPGFCSSIDSIGHAASQIGISHRQRDPKFKRIADFMEGRIPPNANIKRWDGAAKACAAWDSLRMDPELWFDEGNCFVHLYGKGQSRRGPAFRVPLSAILEANCHRLVSRYRLRTVAEQTSTESTHGSQDGSDAAGKVDLYIPPPPMADKKQIVDFYLAMRNLFAWMCRKSVVGEHLGSALIVLMDNMREFRSPGVDNVEDVLDYVAYEGYLDMANQPIHALAMVHLAEHYQLRDLYINAFAHCAGMGDCLYGLPEYQAVSSVTRKLLRRAQTSVEAKLGKAAISLKNFLEDDLSESSMGLTTGGRAHLERFRTFLLAFYTHRLGYYPPSPLQTGNGMWDPEIYTVMRADFEALYDFLVDRTCTMTERASLREHGNISVLHSVHSFDFRHKLKPLPHPLPLLPEAAPSAASKRMSWFGKSESKLRPDRRFMAHVALLKATNSDVPYVTRNPLVSAYRTFEEDSLCSQLKFDKIEKLSQVDARKIRWILIYGVYQTLRNCTDAPLEVIDTNSVGYSVAISTADLPPWKEKTRPMLLRTRSSMNVPLSIPSLPSSGASIPGLESGSRPEADYFSLARRNASVRSAASSAMMPPYEIPPRSGSLSKVPSLTSKRVKSLGSMRSEPRTAPMIEPPRPSGNSTYHEIVVHGYGNGTNDVDVQTETAEGDFLRPGALASRSPSTASNSSDDSSADASDASDASPRSEESWDSGHTSIATTPRDGPEKSWPDLARRASVKSTSSSVYSTRDDEEVLQCPPPVPRRNSKRASVVILLNEEGNAHTPAPLQIKKASPVHDDHELWRAIQDEVNERCEAVPAGRLVLDEPLW